MVKRIATLGVLAVGLLLPLVAVPEAGGTEPAAPSVLPFPVETAFVPPPCWMDHVQVQPAPDPDGSRARKQAETDPRLWSLAPLRLGSEHLDKRQMQQVCREFRGSGV